MSRRRSLSSPGSRTASAAAPRRAPRCRRRNLLEGLEPRLLLTTIITDTDPLTPTPPTQQFEYKDAKGTAVRVVVHGDVSAEFIFAQVQKGAIIATLTGDFVLPGQQGTGAEIPGRDLFQVYVAQASIDSYISIAHVATPSPGSGPRPMQPFSGAVSLRIFPARGTETVKAMPGGTGDIYLGARTRSDSGIQNFGDSPIRQAGFHGIGIAPDTFRHKAVAGLVTAPGVSLGRFMFGGTVSGQVNVGGSMETFYCGNLNTGVTEGQNEGTPLDQNNFHVGGDIRNILVMGSIGTHDTPGADDRDKPTYFTGVDFDVAGRVGQIKCGDDYLGFGTISNNLPSLGLRSRQQELEIRVVPGQNRGEFTEFQNGQFGDDNAFFNNDTFDTAQFLGSINSKQTGKNSVQVTGNFQWAGQIVDKADYYAVPLMAGQTVAVRLLSPLLFPVNIFKNGRVVRVTLDLKSILHVGVFDPDQRLVAADYSNQTETTAESNSPILTGGSLSTFQDPAQQELFSFTADRPGIYRFAVGKDAPGFGTNPGTKSGEIPYQLQITGLGNLGLGGLFVGQTLLSEVGADTARTTTSLTRVLPSIEVVNGDLGAIYVPTDYVLSLGGVTGIADTGNFRALDALDLGIQNAGVYRDDVTIWALVGSVGMIRASDAQGTASSCGINQFGGGTSTINGILPIGGNVQYIETNNTLLTDITCNGSIGVIHANQISVNNYAGSINVNADGKGAPGVIDLIDVTQDLGTLQSGGPDITTNIGGNVRYIRVGPNREAFRPRIFGGGQPEETTYVQGQSAILTEDSGAQVVITPTQEEELDPTTGLPLTDAFGNEANNSGTLTVLTYPIAPSLTSRGGGGSVIVRVASTRGMQVNSTGGSTEIGELLYGKFSNGTTVNPGPRVIADPGPDSLPGTADDPLGPDDIANTGDEPLIVDPTLDPFNNFPDQSVELRGDRVDVFSMEGTNAANIRNRTALGEIVNTNIGQVGRLEGQTLGIGQSAFQPGMIVEGIDIAGGAAGSNGTVGDTFPFRKTKNALVINGGGESNPAAINVSARGAIGNLIGTGIFQQITANADKKNIKGVIEGIDGAVFVTGRMVNVQIGEGIMPSGTGEFSRAGLYCISSVFNAIGHGPGWIDNVVNQNGSDIRGDVISSSGIGTISLSDGGSIINADIGVISASAQPITNPTDPNNPPPVTSGGTGADFIASREFSTETAIRPNGNIERVALSGNGGIIGSLFEAFDINNVSVEGFGLMNTRFVTVGTGRFGSFTAGGYGFRGVVWDGGQSIDNITATGDGHRLSSAAYAPNVRFSEATGIDPYFGTHTTGLTDINIVLGTTAAAPVRKGASNSGTLDSSDIAVSRDVGNVVATNMRGTSFSIGNNIGAIITKSYTDTLNIVAGRISTLVIGGDATRTHISTSGPMGNISIGGSFKGSSTLSATGQNGSIGNFATGNTLYGNVTASQKINSIRVGTHYGSQGTHTPKGLGQFMVGGDVLTGSILNIGGELAKLVIAGDLQEGALIQIGTLGTKTILGSETGTIDTKPWAT